jgi:hypothetical protein
VSNADRRAGGGQWRSVRGVLLARKILPHSSQSSAANNAAVPIPDNKINSMARPLSVLYSSFTQFRARAGHARPPK